MNTWGGYWVANAVERIGLVQVQAQKSTLIVSYSKLDKPALPRKSRATTEQAAREAVFSFYSSNKSSLPHQVRNVREEIVEMVMAGMSPLDAFAQALKLSPS